MPLLKVRNQIEHRLIDWLRRSRLNPAKCVDRPFDVSPNIIQRCPADGPRAQRINQGIGVHVPAARDVDEPGVGPHRSKLRRAITAAPFGFGDTGA